VSQTQSALLEAVLPAPGTSHKRLVHIEISKEILNMPSLISLLLALLIANHFAMARSFEIMKGRHLRIATSPVSFHVYRSLFFSKVNKNTVHLISLIQFPVALAVGRNSSGHIISMDGISPRMLDWLTVRYGFT
jgi:hypothetical protein